MNNKDKYWLGRLTWGKRLGKLNSSEVKKLAELKTKYPDADYEELADQVKYGKLKLTSEDL
jgi:hypothetical protein